MNKIKKVITSLSIVFCVLLIFSMNNLESSAADFTEKGNEFIRKR